MLGFFFVATLLLCTCTNGLAQNGYNSEMNGRARSVETRKVFVRSKALLVRAAPRLVEAMRPGGVLIVSGVLATERDEVRRAFANQRIVTDVQQDEWLGITLRA